MRAIGDLDHVIVLVCDLERAAGRFARLGFMPTPEALHSTAMGTANATTVFAERTYVELLAVRHETPLSRGFARRLAEREGPFGVAFKTDDAEAAAEAFETAGVGDGGPVGFARPVELVDGVREAAFTIARLQESATPGAPMFVCQHHTPDVVWRPDYLEHGNGVSGLEEVIGVASDLEPLRRAYRLLFGGRLEEAAGELVIRSRTAALRFIEPMAYAARFGRMSHSRTASLEALVFRTVSLERCRSALTGAGMKITTSARGTLLVPPEDACGTMLEFVPAMGE